MIDSILVNWDRDIMGYAQVIPELQNTAFPAWTIKLPDSYGVAIPYFGTIAINEYFSNARIFSADNIVTQDGQTHRVLMLTSVSLSIRETFASLCAEFIVPGENGEKREMVSKSPLLWWKKWKELLGNRNIDERIYDVLGELYVFFKTVSSGIEAEWNGPSGASYDLESNECFTEVKSTLSRSKKEITISNQFQLEPPGKPLYLVLCSFEPSVTSGVSIDGMVENFKNIGYNTQNLNEKLASLGFEEGMSSRKKMFVLHEMLKYRVDENFPRITPDMFVGGVLPRGIKKITYTVDLSGMEAESLL